MQMGDEVEYTPTRGDLNFLHWNVSYHTSHTYLHTLGLMETFVEVRRTWLSGSLEGRGSQWFGSIAACAMERPIWSLMHLNLFGPRLLTDSPSVLCWEETGDILSLKMSNNKILNSILRKWIQTNWTTTGSKFHTSVLHLRIFISGVSGPLAPSVSSSLLPPISFSPVSIEQDLCSCFFLIQSARFVLTAVTGELPTSTRELLTFTTLLNPLALVSLESSFVPCAATVATVAAVATAVVIRCESPRGDSCWFSLDFFLFFGQSSYNKLGKCIS